MAVGVAGMLAFAPAPALALPAGMVSTYASTLGELVFPNSGAAAAQPEFIKGMLLLHNFEYDDARAAFQRAERIDPGFALAFWGEALSHYHPLWFEKDSEAARAALAKLAPTRRERAAKAGTDRERAFLASAEDLFATIKDGPERGAGSKEDKLARDLRYEAALREIHTQENRERARGANIGVEAAALYGLAILSAQQGNRNAAYMRAAAVLEPAYKLNPRHPGIVHYLIHSYDDPKNASQGLCAAASYSKIAAAAPHAKHMPSHIWQPLGRWADVVNSNHQAWEASEAQVAEKHLDSEARDWHSLRFLQYGYLQQRRFTEAQRALDTVVADAADNPSHRLRWHIFRMRAAQVIESERWDMPAYQGSAEGIDAAAVTGDLLAAGIGAARRGDLKGAKAILARMYAVHDGDDQATTAHTSAHHPSPGFASSAKSLQISAVMRKQLTGLVAIAEGRVKDGLATLESAAADADRISFDYGPPNPVKPVHELLGEVHLQLKDAGKALTEFRAALDRDPRRYLSLRGLATAAKLARKPAIAKQAEAELQQIRSYTDKPAQCPAANGMGPGYG